MDKNEAFRKQVLSRLYGLPDPTEPVKPEVEEAKSEEEKITDSIKKEENLVSENDKTKDTSSDKSDTTSPDKSDKTSPDKSDKTSPDKSDKTSPDKSDKTSPDKSDIKEESVNEKDQGKEDVKKVDHSNNNGGASAIVGDSLSSSSNKKNTPPTTTTSHLYSVLMAPLDGHSPYHEHLLRLSSEDKDAGPRKRMRLDNSATEKVEPEHPAESGDGANSKSTADTNNSVGMDLTKNQKRKLKKKKRRHLLNRLEVQRAKDFIYSSENEQFSVEKLRTMIEDVTEFLDAIWDVYCSEARLKGESVEEDGYKVEAVLKCLGASGEGSWGDLQLLSRAKSVLVLRSKNLAASTIARVENELGYDSDTRSFIVRMLKFWMGEIVTKG